jgi:glycerol-3-phosphate dehydrogenase (NAD(P)+)
MTEEFGRAVVVGTTAWGTTLAVHLARNGTPATLLARTYEEAERLESARVHERRLPGIEFPQHLHVRCGADAVAMADLVCFATPSTALRANVRELAGTLPAGCTLLSATKGIDLDTGERMSQVIADEAPGYPIAVLSGPNLSREVAQGLPGTTVIATLDGPVAALRGAFHSKALRVYTTDDVVGVEFGGALKNIIAIAAGIADAFGFGDNAKGAIITRGLAEMTRLGVAAGAEPLTFQGLAGVGDLVATAYSPLSRNRRLGEMLGRGVSLDDALAQLGETAEGVTTVPAALRVAAAFGVEMPITEGLERVLHQGARPIDEVQALLERDPRPERERVIRE